MSLKLSVHCDHILSFEFRVSLKKLSVAGRNVISDIFINAITTPIRTNGEPIISQILVPTRGSAYLKSP